MRSIDRSSTIGLASLVMLGLVTMGVSAHGPENKPIQLVNRPTGATALGETVKTVFERALPNVPGKSLVALEVTYTPGGKSPAHYHPKSSFIYAHVLSGAIRSQVGDEPVRVYQAGEGWFEDPDSHHKVSENASASEPAKLLAVFVVDPKDELLTLERK